jgi:hypothetical protein
MQNITMIPPVATARLQTGWLSSPRPVAHFSAGTSVAAVIPTTADHAAVPSTYTRDRMASFAVKQASPPRGVPS